MTIESANCFSRSEYPLPGPLRIVQFGEGNFLRAFIGWMIQHLNDKGLFSGSIRIVEPLPHGTGDTLNEQNGLYTVLLRGLENGQVVERAQVISCVEGSFNSYRDWDSVLALARLESLQFIFSNTTEAGIEYKPEPKLETTPGTFPAKLTAFLFERFQTGGSGLWIIPCELIERNASCLKQYVLQYAADWNLGTGFIDWVEKENRFVNTLVDRIVAGYPKSEDEALRLRLGYDDKLLVAGEPFHFFALEAPDSLEQVLPLRQSGLDVVLTDDITPYRMRKVFLLNGGHTSAALAAFLSGLDFVDEMVGDELFNRFLRDLLYEEVLPTIELPEQEKTEYLEAVLERFANPFAKHRLHSITLNSVSKWKVRVLPSFLKAYKKTGKLPKRLAFSLAALLVFYENTNGKGKRNRGLPYEILDDIEIVNYFETLWKEHNIGQLVRKVLSRTDFWGSDLNEIDSLASTLVWFISMMKADGVRYALERILFR
ncbi:MAG: tagaturonate reductase [Planctomycetaceae bacterium]|nr:tagaturonate reductase [Planctomycetaceae bacterium]